MLVDIDPFSRERPAVTVLGIDLGTSAIKAVILGDDGTLLASSSAALSISHPRALWSEQQPEDWWTATVEALTAIDPILRGDVAALGLAGQMHGLVLLDDHGDVLRPAILWNDNRSHAECAELDALAKAHTGNPALPGFCAPKLLWLRKHEPDIFARIRHVLLPKDYIRYRLTGRFATDMSDASGTLLFDPARRDWSDAMLDRCSLGRPAMPDLVEGTQQAGVVHPEKAAELGLVPVPVAGGGGDQAAGAVGIGAIEEGDAFLSLGTSGVIFAAAETHRPAARSAVHAFCHAIDDRWHVMSVMLGTGTSIEWCRRIVGYRDTDVAVREGLAAHDPATSPFFLPYLSGERTPHNDPTATGSFIGLRDAHGRADLMAAVLEGVAFSLADGLDALPSPPQSLMVIGGGTRSGAWIQFLADALRCRLLVARDADAGPALGAARLAAFCLDGEPPPWATKKPDILTAFEPRQDMRERQAIFRSLYPAIHRNAEVKLQELPA